VRFIRRLFDNESNFTASISIFLIEDDDARGWNNHTHTRLIVDLLAEYQIEHIYFVKADSSLSENRIRQTQFTRLYASMLPFVNDHDYLITTDVDLLPIAVGDGQYFDSLDANQLNRTLSAQEWQEQQRILLFDLEEFQATDEKWNYLFKEWALSNIGMTALMWRQILRLPLPIQESPLKIEQRIVRRINEDLQTMFGHDGRTADRWFWDQQLISLRLETAQKTGYIVWDRDVLVKKRTNRNRIDRVAWPSSLTADQIDTKFDSHLPRVPETRGSYNEILAMCSWLLTHVLNSDGQGAVHFDRLTAFTDQFQKAI
jgi:hypothetical protein